MFILWPKLTDILPYDGIFYSCLAVHLKDEAIFVLTMSFTYHRGMLKLFRASLRKLTNPYQYSMVRPVVRIFKGFNSFLCRLIS